MIFNAGMIPNITEHPRHRKALKRGRSGCSRSSHALRMRVERTLAWENKFKRRRLRFERMQQRHYGMKFDGVYVAEPTRILRCLKLATSY